MDHSKPKSSGNLVSILKRCVFPISLVLAFEAPFATDTARDLLDGHHPISIEIKHQDSHPIKYWVGLPGRYTVYGIYFIINYFRDSEPDYQHGPRYMPEPEPQHKPTPGQKKHSNTRNVYEA
jgi:hypothetical protein|tara:strand:- start:258 stop:623 length:366 start_codon:yes stop_codon:yes gene_type:complete